MSAGEADPVEHRRLGGRLRAWAARRWPRRGLVLTLLAVLVLLAAGALPEPWRWLVVADGSLFAALGLAMLADPATRGWPRALSTAAIAYLLAVLTLIATGTPAGLALAWPYLVVQLVLACPLGLPCPLGR